MDSCWYKLVAIECCCTKVSICIYIYIYIYMESVVQYTIAQKTDEQHLSQFFSLSLVSLPIIMYLVMEDNI